MPFLEIATNTAIENNLDIAKKASKLTADILNKPESYVMVKVQDEQASISNLLAQNAICGAGINSLSKISNQALPAIKKTVYTL